jgi:hypothetical protein
MPFDATDPALLEMLKKMSFTDMFAAVRSAAKQLVEVEKAGHVPPELDFRSAFPAHESRKAFG